MIEINKMLMIGGASRNVGKTTLIMDIINEFSKNNNIVAIKIKTIYEGDNFFHGKDRSPLGENEKFRIIEEKDINSGEDTAKMLKSGAKRVFKIKVKSQFISEAFSEIYKIIDRNSFLICESNSLREAVKPDLFLLIKHKNNVEMKPSAKKLEKFADRIIYSDGKKHDFSKGDLQIIESKWMIKFKKYEK